MQSKLKKPATRLGGILPLSPKKIMEVVYYNVTEHDIIRNKRRGSQK
jgi:hypothetical protein